MTYFQLLANLCKVFELRVWVGKVTVLGVQVLLIAFYLPKLGYLVQLRC
jgi:hypothetical protein